ncbi:hypothetical protein L6164_012953 [Bauhinia variegata]|uniref:Uncharacterized protein n=1 Tax=Bauhinia variegata TaxID=167791 RepID=A0ACB9PAV3_BAUVA|nr:hypothetical protein L6164_012953 [Bauhinia variegata]
MKREERVPKRKLQEKMQQLMKQRAEENYEREMKLILCYSIAIGSIPPNMKETDRDFLEKLVDRNLKEINERLKALKDENQNQAPEVADGAEAFKGNCLGGDEN